MLTLDLFAPHNILRMEQGRERGKGGAKGTAKKVRTSKGVAKCTEQQARNKSIAVERVQYPPGPDIWLRSCKNVFTRNHGCVYCLCAS